MAATIELIKFRDVLRVMEIPRFVPGLPVPTVELKGEDFSSAQTVAINDAESPEFLVVNKKTIWAELPPNVEQVRTISVISSKFTTTTKASKILFQVGKKTQTISGLLKLVQLFTKWLLTSPGTDVFDPDIGGGLQDLVGQVNSSSRPDRTQMALTLAVSRTRDQIRRAQQDAPRLPVTERLLNATLVSVEMVRTLDEARARVQIDNMAGQSGLAAIEL